MSDIDDVRRMVAADHGLATIAVARADATVHASMVNAGVLDHPITGEPAVGLVAQGGAAKLAHLRRAHRATVVWRGGWQWAAVEGSASLAGPDDELEGFDRSQLPELLRDVFRAAGGTHDDWEEYDRVMAEERRTAVLVAPERVYGVG